MSLNTFNTFTCFGNLPIEARFLIWECANDRSRTIGFAVVQRGRRWRCKTRLNTPPLLHVNHESRKVALSRYQEIPFPTAFNQPDELFIRHRSRFFYRYRSRSFYFDPAADTLELNQEAARMISGNVCLRFHPDDKLRYWNEPFWEQVRSLSCVGTRNEMETWQAHSTPSLPNLENLKFRCEQEEAGEYTDMPPLAEKIWPVEKRERILQTVERGWRYLKIDRTQKQLNVIYSVQ